MQTEKKGEKIKDDALSLRGNETTEAISPALFIRGGAVRWGILEIASPSTRKDIFILKYW